MSSDCCISTTVSVTFLEGNFGVVGTSLFSDEVPLLILACEKGLNCIQCSNSS